MPEKKTGERFAGAVGALVLATLAFGVLVTSAELYPERLTAQGGLVAFAGAFHPVLVHLPIGFFAALFALELLTLLRVIPRQGRAEGLLLFGGIAAAMVASLLGVCLANAGDYDAGALTGHRRMGLALSFGAAVLGLLKIRVWGQGGFLAGLLYWLGLLVVMALLTVAGHLGGSITHGDGFLERDMPAPLARTYEDIMARVPPWLVEIVTGDSGEAAEVAVLEPAVGGDEGATAPAVGSLEQQAVSILESRCWGCHGEKKQKGKLRLDSLAAAVRGGKSGEPAIVGWEPMASELVHRITLPRDVKHTMPPEAKKSLTADEILVLIYWIGEGAPWGGELAPVAAEESAPDEVAPGDVAAGEGPEGAGPRGETSSATRRGPAEISSELAVALDALNQRGAIAMPLGQDTTDVGVDWSLAEEPVADATLDLLAPLASHLRELDLRGSAITDAGLERLAALTSLRTLSLARTGITGAGLTHLAGLSELEVLNLYGTEVTADTLAALSGLGQLRRLYLFETAVDPETDREAIASMLPGVEVDYGWTLDAPVPEGGDEVPEVAASADLSGFFDEGGCCAKAHADGKTCEHPCCVAAAAAGEVCAKCNPEGAARHAEGDK